MVNNKDNQAASSVGYGEDINYIQTKTLFDEEGWEKADRAKEHGC